MADKKKKKAAAKKPVAKKQTKPTAKKTVAGQRSERANVAKKPAKKAATKRTTAAPKAKKQTVSKKSTVKKTTAKKPAVKPLKHSDKEEMTVPKGKSGININITPKCQPKPQTARSQSKQITEQLPDNAKLRTIHLHFKID